MAVKENIQAARVEAELSSLWELEPNADQIRACLFNLIVYTHEPHRTQYFQELVRNMMEKFPCRVIFIQSDDSMSKETFQINVSTELSSSGKLGCDQIIIKASSFQLEKIPFLILPYFVPDLPIYLLWGDDPTLPSPLLYHLEHFAQQLIFDSELTDDLQRFSHMMLDRLLHETTGTIDMNWARIKGWRDILAQTFDSKDRIDILRRTNSITLFYNNKPSYVFSHLETQAVYFQGWLAAQMGWRYQSAQREKDLIFIYYNLEEQTIKVILHPTIVESIPWEEIVKIEIEGEHENHCSLIRHSPSHVVIHCSNADKCDLPVTLPLLNIKQGKNFMRDLFYQYKSSHYINMLKTIGNINWDRL
jgi:glucose-6-phosphate dehydrogenase assembly protein OpcA